MRPTIEHDRRCFSLTPIDFADDPTRHLTVSGWCASPGLHCPSAPYSPAWSTASAAQRSRRIHGVQRSPCRGASQAATTLCPRELDLDRPIIWPTGTPTDRERRLCLPTPLAPARATLPQRTVTSDADPATRVGWQGASAPRFRAQARPSSPRSSPRLLAPVSHSKLRAPRPLGAVFATLKTRPRQIAAAHSAGDETSLFPLRPKR